MSFCVLYSVVLENHSVQNSPWGEGGSISSSRSHISEYIIRNKLIQPFRRYRTITTILLIMSLTRAITSLIPEGFDLTTKLTQGQAGHTCASTRENLSSGVASNTGADQPAHLRSLISAVVICFSETCYR